MFFKIDQIDLHRYSFVRILCVNVDNDDQNISMYNNNKTNVKWDVNQRVDISITKTFIAVQFYRQNSYITSEMYTIKPTNKHTNKIKLKVVRHTHTLN